MTLFFTRGLAIEIEARVNLIGSMCFLEINETSTPASSLMVESLSVRDRTEVFTPELASHFEYVETKCAGPPLSGG